MPADTAYQTPSRQTVRAGTEPYGCQTRKLWTWVKVQDGWTADGRRNMVSIPFVMSVKCRQFGLWDTDPRCQGCQQEKDYEYAERMAAMK